MAMGLHRLIQPKRDGELSWDLWGDRGLQSQIQEFRNYFEIISLEDI
jgi:hypothetical protein